MKKKLQKLIISDNLYLVKLKFHIICMLKIPKFLNQKKIPFLFWSENKTLTVKPKLISVFFLCLGLSIFGLGEALLIASGIGVSPWTVLAQGITNYTNFTVGFATFVISVLVLLCWIPLKQTPGIGTILNAIIVAFVIDFSLPYLPKPEFYFGRILEVLIGVLITGLGGSIYLIANLGPGPRDGLMTGLQKITNFPIAWVRSIIEISIVFLGWILGGTVGFGTLVFAFGIGPSYSFFLFTLEKLFNKKD